MKAYFSIVAILIFNAVAAQYHFTIRGSVNEIFNNEKLFLIIEDNYSLNRYELKDSTVIKDSKFIFSGNIFKPSEWGYIFLKQGNSFFYFVIDSGLNEMIIRPVMSNSPTFKNKLSNTIINNSESNKLYKQIDSLDIKYILSYGRPSPSNKYILELTVQRSKELKIKEMQLIRKYPGTFYSLIQLYQLSLKRTIDVGELTSTFENLHENLKLLPLGIELRNRIQLIDGMQIGKEVPDFTTNTERGSVFSNKSLLGKPYLLIFGATWCIPCKKKYPMLKGLYEKYRSKGLEIVSINLDDNSIIWKRQIKDFKLTWINVSEAKKWRESDLVRLFNVLFVPLYIIVDRHGIITYHSAELEDDKFEMLEHYIIKCIN